MCHLVVVQVAAGREPLPVDPALVGLLPGVDPPVGVEAGAGAEPLLTFRADVRLLSSVGPDVSLQQTGSVEGLPTDVAGQHGLLLGSPAGAGPGGGLLGGEVE